MALQIIKKPDVQRITGLSGSSIYRLVSDGTFPKPIKISARSSGWILTEVEAYLEARIKASRPSEVQ